MSHRARGRGVLALIQLKMQLCLKYSEAFTAFSCFIKHLGCWRVAAFLTEVGTLEQWVKCLSLCKEPEKFK